MRKINYFNKLNSQKGITGADIVISMLIILTALGVIVMVYTNLTMSSKEIDRKTSATRIATNIIENLDMIYYDEIKTTLKSLSDSGIATKVDSTYTIVGDNGIKVFKTKIPNGYKLVMTLSNNMEFDIVNKVTVRVEYTVDKQVKNVEINKVFEREVIRECNSPNFTEEYIRQMIDLNTDYEMFSQTSFGLQTGIKIICPIQYDANKKKYKVIDISSNQIWYSYSNKEWARVLILESDELNDNVDLETMTLNNIELLKNSDKSYIWIPRFGIKMGGDLFGDTIFKYKNTDLAILNSYLNDEKLIYNYLDFNETIEWSTRGISFEENVLLGKWFKYSELTEVSSDAYLLNQSQYGPMIEY